MKSAAETEAYLEKIAQSGSILGLESMQGLMEELGNVHRYLEYVHVAGTNGKGSVCAMVSSILQQAGIRVGRYTSPAVFDRREQYQVNGKNITSEEFVQVVSEVKEACDSLVAKGRRQPTVFEVETAAAFLYFYLHKCQVVVLETGMGGTGDATNIIERPLVSVLTSISMDHMKFLGNNLQQIARIKAGIIKEGCRVVAVRPGQEAVRRVIEEICCQNHALLVYSSAQAVSHYRYCQRGEEMRQYFHYPCRTTENPASLVQSGEFSENYMEIELSMMGGYQIENAACAIETARTLRDMGLSITDEAIRAGLLQTYWEGRFSVLCRNPLFVIDGAHNADAAKKLAETVKRGFTNWQIIYIIGVLADKEHEEMLRIMLPLAQQVFTVTPDNPRAMDGRVLAAEAGKYHERVFACPAVKEAVQKALSVASGGESMVLAFGSLSYLRELREALKEILQNGG